MKAKWNPKTERIEIREGRKLIVALTVRQARGVLSDGSVYSPYTDALLDYQSAIEYEQARIRMEQEYQVRGGSPSRNIYNYM